MTPGKAIAAILAGAACFAVPLFVTAWTFDWWRAWLIVGFDVAFTVFALIDMPRAAPGLIEERMNAPVRAGQPVGERIVFPLLLATFFGIEIASAFECFHVRLLPVPPAAVSWLGLAGFAGGWIFMYVAMRQNAFASAVVRYQEDRGQHLVDTGVYAVVRHPMYSGGLLFMFGLPLFLQSYLGALVALLIIPIGAARIHVEETLLRAELPGYADYERRVRFRLIPGVW